MVNGCKSYLPYVSIRSLCYMSIVIYDLRDLVSFLRLQDGAGA